MNPHKIHRRDAVKTITVGSTTLFPAWKLAAAQSSNAAASSSWKPRFLTTEQNELVTTLAELIIPETDTPGARAAKVNEHIDLVLSDEIPEIQQAFLDGLRWELPGWAPTRRPASSINIAERTMCRTSLWSTVLLGPAPAARIPPKPCWPSRGGRVITLLSRRAKVSCRGIRRRTGSKARNLSLTEAKRLIAQGRLVG